MQISKNASIILSVKANAVGGDTTHDDERIAARQTRDRLRFGSTGPRRRTCALRSGAAPDPRGLLRPAFRQLLQPLERALHEDFVSG